MRNLSLWVIAFGGFILLSCNQQQSETTGTTETTTAVETHTQANVDDTTSSPDVVKVAAKSPDHTTLVSLVQKADLVTALSNTGPFTVFAPTNAAFDKLPKELVASLTKDENKNDLIDELQYHVYVGVLKAEYLSEGQTLGMVNGKNVTVKMVNGKPMLNGKASIVASVPASNGIIHVIDEVLLPE